jgi:hypothetical protein
LSSSSSFPEISRKVEEHPRDVAVRFGERRDEPGGDRVRLVVVRHDRNGCRRLLGRLDGDGPDGVNHIDLVAHQRPRERDNVDLARRSVVLDSIVLSLGVALVVETGADVRDVLPNPVIEWPLLGAQHCDARELIRRLALASKWRHEKQEGDGEPNHASFTVGSRRERRGSRAVESRILA